MKGISTILAMILIVIIVVALIGLTYTFAVGLFGTTTAGTTEEVEAVTERMQKSVSVVAARCSADTATANTNTTWFTVKNTGTRTIARAELSAYIADESMVMTTDFPSGGLAKGVAADVVGVVTQALSINTMYTLKVSAPAADVTYRIENCTVE